MPRQRHRPGPDRQSDDRRQNQYSTFHPRPQVEAQPADAPPHQGGGQPDDDGPAELGPIRVAERREVGNGQGERAVARPTVEPHEDHGAHAGRQQSGHQHQPEHRAAQPRRLHEEECAGERRAQHGADGGETAGRRHHRDRLLWGIALAIRTTSAAIPPPMAMSGASGPSTTPNARVASAAMVTPGNWAWRGRAARCETRRRANDRLGPVDSGSSVPTRTPANPKLAGSATTAGVP